MFRKTLVAALAFGLLLGACARRRQVSLRRLSRNPPSLPTVPTSTGGSQLDPQVARTAMPGFEFHPNFETALQEKGLYTPDICLQWVKMTKGAQELGTYLEMSSVPCPGGSLVSENDVLLRLKVEQHAQFNTQYKVIIEQSYSPVIGRFRKFTDNGVDHFRMEGLCEVDVGEYNESWDNYCTIAVENSLFRKPDPLDTFNLD